MALRSAFGKPLPPMPPVTAAVFQGRDTTKPPLGGECSKTPIDIQWQFHKIAKKSQAAKFRADVAKAKANSLQFRRTNKYAYDVGKPQYAYIPLCLDSFHKLVGPHLKPGMHVIDVGCGAGDKLYEFHNLCDSLKITGLEYRPSLARHAKRICGEFATVLRGDALKHNYQHYDLIYMYCPLSKWELQAELQDRVMSQMKLGAKLCIALQAWRRFDTPNYFPELKGWVKKEQYVPATRSSQAAVTK